MPRAKLSRFINGNEFPLGISLGVAFDTLVQAVLDIAVTLAHGQVAVVEQEIHMLLAHNLCRLNAHVTLAPRHLGHIGQ